MRKNTEKRQFIEKRAQSAGKTDGQYFFVLLHSKLSTYLKIKQFYYRILRDSYLFSLSKEIIYYNLEYNFHLCIYN